MLLTLSQCLMCQLPESIPGTASTIGIDTTLHATLCRTPADIRCIRVLATEIFGKHTVTVRKRC